MGGAPREPRPTHASLNGRHIRRQSGPTIAAEQGVPGNGIRSTESAVLSGEGVPSAGRPPRSTPTALLAVTTLGGIESARSSAPQSVAWIERFCISKGGHRAASRLTA